MSKKLDSLRVDYKNLSSTTTVDSSSMDTLKVEISAERNNGNTTFVPTDIVYVDVYALPPEIILGWSNYGTLRFSGTRTVTVDEYQLFQNETEKDLQFVPDSFSYNWVGRMTGPANVTREEAKIRTSAEVLGVLHLAYSRTISVYEFTGGQIPTFLVFSTATAIGNCQVNYGDGDAAQFVDVWVNVVDYMSDNNIVGAHVRTTGPTGTFNGITGSDGRVYIGKLPVGGHYTLEMSATNYIDSALDSLENDGFTVPSE